MTARNRAEQIVADWIDGIENKAWRRLMEDLPSQEKLRLADRIEQAIEDAAPVELEPRPAPWGPRI